MGCSAWPAKFGKTITGTWEVLVDGAVNHVIWYQNRVGENETNQIDPAESTFQWLVAQRKVGRDLQEFQEKMEEWNIHPSQVDTEVEWRQQGGKPRRFAQVGQMEVQRGNCLIIPIMGSWESIKLLNTADTPRLLTDIETALQLPDGGALSASGAPTGLISGDSGRMAFLQSDVYDVVFAENAASIAEVLERIDVEKRPDVDSRVFKRLEQWYRCPLALCCFKSSQQAETKPIGIAFKPIDPDQIVVYTLEAFDGYPPNPFKTVDLDHTIFVGSYRTPEEYTSFVPYRDSIPYDLKPYLLDRVLGMPINNTQMYNGDIVFDAAAVRAGCFNGLRALPRYSPAQHKDDNRITRRVAYGNGKRSLIEKS